MSCIYGDRQFGSEDQGWLAWFVIRTLTGNPITIYGDGKQVRDALFVTDHNRAFEMLADKKNISAGKAFCLGGGAENTISLLELLDLIEKVTGKRSDISFSNWRLGDQKVFVTDNLKIKETIGWSPEISVEEGVKKLIEWTEKNINLFNN